MVLYVLDCSVALVLICSVAAVNALVGAVVQRINHGAPASTAVLSRQGKATLALLIRGASFARQQSLVAVASISIAAGGMPPPSSPLYGDIWLVIMLWSLLMLAKGLEMHDVQ